MSIDELITKSHNMAVEKGWWEQPREFGTQIALMHSELSEALEEFRVHGMDPSYFIYEGEKGKPEGIAVEFADVLIRIFDTCGKYNIPLSEALFTKMFFNAQRPHRHGNKNC